MPLTLAHPAAVLPLWRWRRHLPFPALVVGSMAPDFEYLLYLRPASGIGHTPLGVLLVSLPLAAIMFALLHALWLPALRQWLDWPTQAARPSLAAIVLALLLGIGSHLLWDGFTHRTSPLVQALPGMLVLIHGVPLFHWLQHASTAIGLCAIALFGLRVIRPILGIASWMRLCWLLFALWGAALLPGIANAMRVSRLELQLAYLACGTMAAFVVLASVLAAWCRWRGRWGQG
ncbi:DUF4184 family protein [Chitinimonas sp.]|uniref:DUF4184 family protein n=1 Tax=Chitinimonas sp. TaxID=1934313 RepID=UPI0035B00BD2